MDLVVLVADKQMEQAVQGILGRPKAIGIRSIASPTVLVHPNRDPGVFTTGHELVAPYAKDHEHALLMLDMAWDGRPSDNPTDIEQEIEGRCAGHWADRATCVAIDPELEVWVWAQSPHVATVLGWESHDALGEWLAGEGLIKAGNPKPEDPKLAFVRALREKQRPPSAARFRQLAEHVSFEICNDRAFGRLLDTLRGWFPEH